MNPEEYHKMHQLERRHWWFQGRRRMVHTLLAQAEQLVARARPKGAHPAPVRGPAALRYVDIGCGTGMLLEDLQARGTAVGLDFSPLALGYCLRRELASLARADVRHLPLPTNSVDVITAIDLVEHIRDDIGLLGEFFRVLAPGGVVVIGVPAHPRLWSEHDVALHHFRRYTRTSLHELVANSGLQIERLTYMMAAPFAPAVVVRTGQNLMRGGQGLPAAGGQGQGGGGAIRGVRPAKTNKAEVGAPLNMLLQQLLYTEAALLARFNMPVGLSLACIAQKPMERLAA